MPNNSANETSSAFDALGPLTLLDKGEMPDLDYRQSSELIDRGLIQLEGNLHEGTYSLEITNSGKIYLDQAQAPTATEALPLNKLRAA